MFVEESGEQWEPGWKDTVSGNHGSQGGGGAAGDRHHHRAAEWSPERRQPRGGCCRQAEKA